MEQTNTELHSWVISFLRTSGNNPQLAQKLEQDGQYIVGPVDYPLKRLTNPLGSDKTFKFQENEKVLNTKVEKMIRDIKEGWDAPPLIVTNFWEDYFEIADGGHRYYALTKLGRKNYSTIFYFRDRVSIDKFIAKQKPSSAQSK